MYTNDGYPFPFQFVSLFTQWNDFSVRIIKSNVFVRNVISSTKAPRDFIFEKSEFEGASFIRITGQDFFLLLCLQNKMERPSRDRKPSSKFAQVDQIGADNGPLLTILFTVEEANGNCLTMVLPYGTLCPKDIVTGELLESSKLKTSMKVLCLYPHDKLYYPAVLRKIGGRKRKSETTEKEDDQNEHNTERDMEEKEPSSTEKKSGKSKIVKKNNLSFIF
uniref:Uncharacterized protein n=1 Tax=Clytia hemisphaerica TaxID=252671 RepID=A0A7M5WW50_9CNID